MKDEEAQAKTSGSAKKEGLEGGGLFGRGRYKFWALAAILVLAFWSLLTGSVTLNCSTRNLNPLLDHFGSPFHNDLDVLEVEEREKVVRRMWDVYTHSSTIQLPRFWQEAFQAAYQDLTSEIAPVRNVAVLEIAKMSMFPQVVDQLEIEQNPTLQTKATPSSITTTTTHRKFFFNTRK